MIPDTSDSPADEYERRFAEKQEAARKSVRRCLGLWAGAHGAVAIVVAALWAYVLMFIAFRPVTPPGAAAGFWLIAALGGVAGLCAVGWAGKAAVVGLKQWQGLSGFWRAAALTPWLVTSGEALWLLMELL